MVVETAESPLAEPPAEAGQRTLLVSSDASLLDACGLGDKADGMMALSQSKPCRKQNTAGLWLRCLRARDAAVLYAMPVSTFQSPVVVSSEA